MRRYDITLLQEIRDTNGKVVLDPFLDEVNRSAVCIIANISNYSALCYIYNLINRFTERFPLSISTGVTTIKGCCTFYSHVEMLVNILTG